MKRVLIFFFQAEDGMRDVAVTGVQTCALPISFEDVLKFQPAFGPALEHLAWVHIVEGDSARATAALAGRERLGNPSDPPSFATLALVELAYAWRFFPGAPAVRRADGPLRQAKRVGVTPLHAGGRDPGAFCGPRGAL